MKENKILFTQALHIQRKDEYKSLYAFARLLPLCELYERAPRMEKALFEKYDWTEKEKHGIYVYNHTDVHKHSHINRHRVPRKGDRHAGDIRQDQSSGRE